MKVFVRSGFRFIFDQVSHLEHFFRPNFTPEPRAVIAIGDIDISIKMSCDIDIDIENVDIDILKLGVTPIVELASLTTNIKKSM